MASGCISTSSSSSSSSQTLSSSLPPSSAQHMNVFVISDSDTGCIADLIKKGMALPDPAGNKQYFPKDYDVTCYDGLVKNGTNTFHYIEESVVPALHQKQQSAENENNNNNNNTASAPTRGEVVEQLYLFVYPPSLEKQFQDYIGERFGKENALTVSGWADIAKDTAFSPIWASTIYHEGRHLAIHGTWHDDAGNPLPGGKIISYSSSTTTAYQNQDPAGKGLARFLNLPPARNLTYSMPSASPCALQ
jgi:hypothetical protein